MDLKLAQELASVDQHPLFLVLIDLIKTYDNLDWGRLLQTLEGYGEGPKLWGLLEGFWSRQEVVTCQNVFHIPQFQATRVKTQGGSASPTLFNVEVDRVIRHWMPITMEDESTTNEGIGTEIGMCMVVFYADDSIIVSRDTEWLQGDINVLIGIFRRVGLMVNVEKYKTMKFHTRDI